MTSKELIEGAYKALGGRPLSHKEETMTTLADVIEFIDDPSAFQLEHNGHEIAFQDDHGLSCGSNGEFFLAGHEFGATVLIHARGYESAWEAWIDEQETIPESELPEAYGVPDSDEIDAWKEANPAPHYGGSEWKAWCEAMHAEEVRILRAWGDAAQAEERDYPELIEGYEMQSNCSGTGIVDVGHYSWMNEADLSEITLVRKAVQK